MEEMYELEAGLLQRCVDSREEVLFYLMNGFQLHCRVLDYDRNAIHVRREGKEQMIYRHAVSTVVLPKK